jgi:hypothetical protein
MFERRHALVDLGEREERLGRGGGRRAPLAWTPEIEEALRLAYRTAMQGRRRITALDVLVKRSGFRRSSLVKRASQRGWNHRGGRK